jgi:hypothetical protein
MGHAAACPTRGRFGWSAFDRRAIAGRWPGRIRGILIETLFEFRQPLLQRRELLFVMLHQQPDGRLRQQVERALRQWPQSLALVGEVVTGG